MSSENREANAKRAREWLNTVNTLWHDEIEQSLANTYCENDFKLRDNIEDGTITDTKVHLWFCNVQDAVRRFMAEHPDEKLCVLNFANYKNLGGKFIDGSMAQEEALCHESALYPILSQFSGVYYSRKDHLRNGLYGEDFIYAEQVPFLKDPTQHIYRSGNMYKVDILTYAAPCLLRRAVTDAYYRTMYVRMINAMVYPAVYRGATSIMLGAWGCGVFCNPPRWVAKQWDYLSENGLGKYYNHIIHPVPYGRNAEAFHENIIWHTDTDIRS